MLCLHQVLLWVNNEVMNRSYNGYDVPNARYLEVFIKTIVSESTPKPFHSQCC